MGDGGGEEGCAFHVVEMFHFVEIYSEFFKNLQNGLEFFK